MTFQLPTSQENDQIRVTVNRRPGSKALLEIQTKVPALQAARETARKNVMKNVNIPGFRKGKAPAALVEQQYAPHIEQEQRDVLIRNSLNEAIRLSQVRPFTQETEIRVKDFKKLNDDAFEIQIEFEAFPEIPSIDPTVLSVEEVKPEPVTKELIDQKIEELRLYHADWTEVADRGAQEGDYIVIDLHLIDEEAPVLIHENSRFYMKEGKMPEWAFKLLQGAKVGESVEGMSEPEGKETSEEFKPRKCRFTVRHVQTATLPPVDDVLSKKAGVESADKLPEAIEKSLTKQHTDRALHQNRLAMQRLVTEKYPFDMPASRMEQLHEECHAIANEEGATLPNDEARHAYAHQMMDEAKRTVLLSYLLPKVFADNKLAFPTPQEIQHRSTEKMIARYMAGDHSALQDDPTRLARIAESEMITERAIDFLIENSKKA